jgi:hypothetical protein
MYLCVSSHVSVFLGIQFCLCFYDFSIRFWRSSDSVLFFILEEFRQCGIFYFGGAPTVWYFLFWRSSDSVVFFILEEFRQCYFLYCWSSDSVLFLFWRSSDSVVFFILKEFRQCGIFYFSFDQKL